MITENHITTYKAIRIAEGTHAAGDYARSVFAELGLTKEQINATGWDQIKRDWNAKLEKELAERNAAYEAKKAEEKAAKKAAKANQASIHATCTTLLKNRLLSTNERKFLSDIKTKRKLTEKQEKWLRDIAAKVNHQIVGEFQRKAKKIAPAHCQHEDLGSLGYTHGDIVRCPFCGEMAEVW